MNKIVKKIKVINYKNINNKLFNQVCDIQDILTIILNFLIVNEIVAVKMTSLLKKRTFHNCIHVLINKCKELVELNSKYTKEFPRGSLELLKDQIPTRIVCACQNARIDDVKLFINLHFYYKYIRINSIKESNMTIREMLNQKGINSLGVESTIFKSLYDNIYHKKYKKNSKILSKNSKEIRKYILFELIDNFKSSKDVFSFALRIYLETCLSFNQLKYSAEINFLENQGSRIAISNSENLTIY